MKKNLYLMVISCLFIAGSSFGQTVAGIYQRKLKTHAVGAFTPWMSMTPGKL